MGGKPTEIYTSHPSDARKIEEAEELHLEDYAEIATGQAQYEVPPTVSRRATPTVFAEFTCPAMFKTVLEELAVHGLLELEPDDLAYLGFSDDLAATTTSGATDQCIEFGEASARSQRHERTLLDLKRLFGRQENDQPPENKQG